MLILKRAEALTQHVLQLKNEKKTIGFVPTMGALHQGHFSLITEAKKNNDFAVCSIFINPTQFNNKDDFNHYPTTIEKDIDGLIGADCDVLFLPAEPEIYPPSYLKKHYPIGEIETILEGKFRPGHFQGVCQVVDRLLEIVQPHRLYLGQKDYQQCIIISKLLQLTGNQHIEVVIVPTIREADGLAMSSRNLRLNDLQRKKAATLFAVLANIKNNLQKHTLSELVAIATLQLEKEGFQVDYVSIAERDTLFPATGNQKPLIALVAATIDNIRLIDNLLL